ncbi:unnamed protein product, partial [Mesorhabditis spiculigera]
MLYMSCMVLGGIYLLVVFGQKPDKNISMSTTRILYGTFAAVALVGVVVLGLLQQKSTGKKAAAVSHRMELMKTVRMLGTVDQWLIAIPSAFTGIENSFFSGVYSTALSLQKQLTINTNQLMAYNSIATGVGQLSGGLLFALLGKWSSRVGSSNGIGRGIAVHFAARGAKVTITGRSEAALYETRKECVAAGAPENDILALVGNLAEEEFMTKLVHDTVEKFGKLDFLINNAGVTDEDMCNKKPGFLTQDMQSYDYIFLINVRCVVFLSREATPHLEKTKGAIVNMSSIAASEIQAIAFPYYGMSKSALDSLTRSLALELIRKGIRVNGIK